MPGIRWISPTVLAVVTLAANPVSAAVIVLSNATEQPLACEIRHCARDSEKITLAPGETRAVRVGKEPLLVAGPDRVLLEPYHAYFLTRDSGRMQVQGVEIVGKMPAAEDVGEVPDRESKPVRLGITLLADDADPRARAVWEKALRARVSAAADVIERACGIRLEVDAVAEWRSNPAAKDFPALRKDFETTAKPEKGTIAVGFTSRKSAAITGGIVSPNGTATPLGTHILLRENFPRTEAERVELLVHELARALGAVRSPDRLSVMRPRLDDELATSAKHRTTFDPLNLLALNIVAEELRAGNASKLADLSPAGKDRLRAIYDTVAKAVPDDPLPRELAKSLAPAAVVAKNPDPAVTVPKDPPLSKAERKLEATRKVLKAVVLRAEDLSRLPNAAPTDKLDAPGKRPIDDHLTIAYVRAAADTANTLDDDVKVHAFLIGLGIALDDSALIRNNPTTKKFWTAVESEEDRKERLKVLGKPTVQKRRDLCQHFFVSAALAAHLGPEAAEAAGITKELLDAVGGTGFSFVDLAVDLAGIAFAARIAKDPQSLDTFARVFYVGDHAPKIEGLVEGLPAAKFFKEYGSASDPRFHKAMEEVRKRVASVPAAPKLE